jgi:TM2 domain-containing membrane protein YozV
VTAVNIMLLLWTVVPVIVVIVGAYFFLRAGKRWEDRQGPPR